VEVLKRLFEQHYRFQPEQVRPLQGQLGGSGRAIVRLAGQGISAIGILYSVREETSTFSRCQPIKVAGLTMTRALLQSQNRDQTSRLKRAAAARRRGRI
jgi:hypothetical protein